MLDQKLPVPTGKRIVLLTGARQTGKTTLAKAKYPAMRYINLDAPENREAVRTVLSSFWARDVGEAVLDEAQKEPVVFDKVKFAFDEGAIRFSVLLGSSQILLLKKVRETLAGRVSIFELWPLMMEEIFNDSAEAPQVPPLIDRLLAEMSLEDVFGSEPGLLLGREDALRRDAQERLLQWGGMPALLSLPPEERLRWLKDYEYTYLERDV
ncbi:MAG TPA: AAA family ATPase, partial [Syntrophales bacterium]|nr:AAA family ATPase [Syntrophales bacterium]